MNYALNLLIKVLGGFMTTFGAVGLVQMLKQPTTSTSPTGWVVVSLTIGLALLFSPEIKNK